MFNNARNYPAPALHTQWVLCVRILCYVLIFLGAVYRIENIVDFNPIHNIWSDPQRHLEQGVDVTRNDPMAMTDPVLFQLYIGALMKLTLKIPELVAFYTILLAVAAPWVWYRFFCELQDNKLYALIGWATLSILPGWIGIYSYFMQETLMLPLLGLALFYTWRCKRKSTMASFVTMVFVWALAGLTRGICIPMAAVATLWVWNLQDDKLKRAVAGIAVLITILGPLTYRAFHEMKIFAPHGISYLNQIYATSGNEEIVISYHRQGARWHYVFKSPAMMTPPFEPFSNWGSSRQGQVNVSVNIDHGGEDWQQALGEQSWTLDKYWTITKENLIFLFFAPSWPDSNKDRFEGWLNHHSRWIWMPLSILCLLWTILQLWQWRKKQPQNTGYPCIVKMPALLPAIIIVWFIVQGLLPISVNEGRYRKPLTGLLIAQFIGLASLRNSRRITSVALLKKYNINEHNAAQSD